MFTVKGYFGDGNTIQCDDGTTVLAYPYGLDHIKVYHKTGYFLLKPFLGYPDKFIIVNYIIIDDCTTN